MLLYAGLITDSLTPACVGVNGPWIIKGCIRFDSNGYLYLCKDNNLNFMAFVRIRLIGYPILIKGSFYVSLFCKYSLDIDLCGE